MKILLINHYAGSQKKGMEYRPYYLAKEWIKNGHQVKIVAATFSHVRNNQPIVHSDFYEERVEGIEYFWLKTPTYQGNSAKRFINMLIFVTKLWFKANFLATTIKPDVVIASSTYPLDIYPAKKIAKKSKAELVFEIHDLWTLSPMELGGYSKYHPFIAIMQMAENIAYKNADKVISILPKTLEHTVEHGLNPNKWFCVSNGINIEDWNNIVEVSDDYKKNFLDFKHKQQFLVGYLGSHGLANALEYLIEAAKLLQNEKITFVFVGKGNEKQNLIEKAIGLQNVVFLDYVTKNAIPDLLKYLLFFFL